ncbi:MAG: PH domain-containing protein [Minisyncoccia bacterium]
MENPPPVPAQPAYRKLGTRTLWMMLSDQMVPSFIVLVAAVLLSIAQANGVFAKTIIGAWSLYIVLGVWALCVLVFVITFLVAYLSYANFLFMLDDNALKIRRGILSKEETAIPYRQIQDVDIEQNISERIWGVVRLAILTAGHEEAKEGDEDESEGILPAIDRALAESLQAELLKRADVEKMAPPTAGPS